MTVEVGFIDRRHRSVLAPVEMTRDEVEVAALKELGSGWLIDAGPVPSPKREGARIWYFERGEQ